MALSGAMDTSFAQHAHSIAVPFGLHQYGSKTYRVADICGVGFDRPPAKIDRFIRLLRPQCRAQPPKDQSVFRIDLSCFSSSSGSVEVAVAIEVLRETISGACVVRTRPGLSHLHRSCPVQQNSCS